MGTIQIFQQNGLLFLAILMILWVMRNPILARIYKLKSLSVNEAYNIYKKKYTKTVFLDVRTAWETKTSVKIKKSMFIPLNELTKSISNLKESLVNQQVIIVCHSGRRAVAAGIKLKKAGIKDVLVMQGGITAWANANYPLSNKKGK